MLELYKQHPVALEKLINAQSYSLVRINNFMIKSYFQYKREENIKQDVNVVKEEYLLI